MFGGSYSHRQLGITQASALSIQAASITFVGSYSHVTSIAWIVLLGLVTMCHSDCEVPIMYGLDDCRFVNENELNTLMPCWYYTAKSASFEIVRLATSDAQAVGIDIPSDFYVSGFNYASREHGDFLCAHDAPLGRFNDYYSNIPQIAGFKSACTNPLDPASYPCYKVDPSACLFNPPYIYMKKQCRLTYYHWGTNVYDHGALFNDGEDNPVYCSQCLATAQPYVCYNGGYALGLALTKV